MRNTTALLPSGENMNALSPESHFCYHDDMTALVVERVGTTNRSLRVLTTAGGTRGWEIGQVISGHHDQTGRPLGDFKIIGMRNFESGSIYGVVYDRPLRHYVFK